MRTILGIDGGAVAVEQDGLRAVAAADHDALQFPRPGFGLGLPLSPRADDQCEHCEQTDEGPKGTFHMALTKVPTRWGP